MSAWRLQNEAPVRLLLKYPLRQFLFGIEKRSNKKGATKEKPKRQLGPLMDGQDFYFPQLMIGPVLTLVLPPDGNVRSHFQVNREPRGRHESIDKNSRWKEPTTTSQWKQQVTVSLLWCIKLLRANLGATDPRIQKKKNFFPLSNRFVHAEQEWAQIWFIPQRATVSCFVAELMSGKKLTRSIFTGILFSSSSSSSLRNSKIQSERSWMTVFVLPTRHGVISQRKRFTANWLTD